MLDPPTVHDSEREPVTPSDSSRRALLAARIALGALLVFAGWTRLGQAHLLFPEIEHQDEPWLVNRAVRIADSGDLNPHFFGYGTLVIYLQSAAVAVEAERLERRAPDDPVRIASLGEVRYRGATSDPLVNAPADTPPWWVSHPSLYVAARAVSVLTGLLTLALVFSLARGIAGLPAAVFAAATLAFDTLHTRNSGWATVDATCTLLALAILWQSVRFRESGSTRALGWAALATGLTASTKYPFVLAGFVPLVLLWRKKELAPRRRLAHTALFGGVALATFLATTPYALLDAPRFLSELAWLARYYFRSTGEGLHSAIPGLAHAAELAAQVGANLGPATTLLALAGAALALRTAAGRILLAPVVPLLLLFGATATSFARNLLLLHPLAAICAGVAAAAILDLPARLEARPARTIGRVVAGAALALVLLLGARRASAEANDRWAHRSSRDKLTDRLVAEVPERRLLLAAELGFSPLQLARLGTRAVVRPLEAIACDADPEALVVTPERVESVDEPGSARVARLNRLLALAGPARLRRGTLALRLDRPRPAGVAVLLREPWSAESLDASLCPDSVR